MTKLTFNNVGKILGFSSFWLLVFLIILIPHLKNFFNADEGVVLEGAWNLYNGRRLYLDFFEFIPPASFYLIFTVWKITGVSFWSANLISIFLTTSLAFGLYRCAQLIRPGRLNLLAPLIFALTSSGLWLINHNVYQLVCTIWAIYFALLALQKNSWKYYAKSGLLAGLSILFLQQKGLMISGATFLFILLFDYSWQKLLAFCLTTVTPLFLLLFWPITLIYENLLIFPLFNYIEVNRLDPAKLIASLIILIGSGLFLIDRKNPDKKVILILIVSFFLLISALPLPDFYHVVLSALPLLSLVGLTISRISQEKTWMIKLAHTNVLIIAIFFFLSMSTAKPSLKKSLPSWLEQIKNCPGKEIYAGPFAPNIYFEARKLNATAFPLLIAGHSTPEHFAGALDSLKAKKPACAILAYPASLARFRHNPDNILENYIQENYHLVATDESRGIYIFHLSEQF